MSERRGSVVNQAQACPQQPDLGTGRTSSWGRWSRPSLGKMVTALFIFDDSIRCACQVRKALLAPPLLAGVTECPPPSRSRASLVRGLGGAGVAGSVCTDCLQAGPHVQAAARGSLGRFQLLFSDSFKGCFTLQKMASAGPLSNSHTILTVTNRGAVCLSLEPGTSGNL